MKTREPHVWSYIRDRFTQDRGAAKKERQDRNPAVQSREIVRAAQMTVKEY